MGIDAAYILCAGLGTRMGPIGTVLPKPLWPLFEKTCLDLVILQVKALSINNIIINTHHLSNKIEEHIKNTYDVGIHVLHEPILLGSGGAIHNVKKHFPWLKKILVLNADFFFLLTPQILKLALNEMKNELSLLFSITVPFGAGLNQICVMNGLLKNIIHSSLIKSCAFYETYAGVCILNLGAMEYREGISNFFDTVANFQSTNVRVFSDYSIEWYDVGTKQSYQDFYYRFVANWIGGNKNTLIEILSNHSFVIPNKISPLGSYGAAPVCSRVFNFDSNWSCPDIIPSDTFILKAPVLPIKASGLYFGEYVDKN
ncbi:MAG: NTP transferase domain-containing protein [Bdellovibrio sp.]|nr:NTP transferase domain-containing protein [Bdellovibrio sp.]